MDKSNEIYSLFSISMISRKLRKTMTKFLGKAQAATGIERSNQWAIMFPVISQSPVNIEGTETP